MSRHAPISSPLPWKLCTARSAGRDRLSETGLVCPRIILFPWFWLFFTKGNVARYPQGLAVDKARGLITTLTRLVHSREAPCGYLAARGTHPNVPRSGGSCCWRRGIRSIRPGTARVEASTRRSEDRCFFFFGHCVVQTRTVGRSHTGLNTRRGDQHGNQVCRY